MHTLTPTHFPTVKTEGGILPADLLLRLALGRGPSAGAAQRLDGLTPEAYHLLAGERLNEAINRSWNRCLAAWRGFAAQREALPASDRATTLTRERWLLILFQELGYGRLQFASGGLPLDAANPDAAAYPISHRWETTPIHLVSFRDDLDRRGAEKRSPHSLVQEYLNRAEGALWGFLSNGLRLRILRDNASLTRPAFVEFDLEAMMAGEMYADFSLLWLVCHQSRVEGPARSCWLERWSQTAAEQGVRALDALRDGVQEAIEALGRGFLAHPANGALRKALQDGELSGLDYYRQLLRLVYRLIILFVAEDRDLFFPPEALPEARQRYTAHYSLGRLRETAAQLRGSPHPDLYRGLRLLFELLRKGYPGLGVPALGGFLFSVPATPALDAADIANESLLNATRALTLTVEGKVRRAVDYRNLDSEELGSVYESLLELHPQVNVAAASFALAVVAGSERKTTGSHYTATPLVNQLLDSALEPVIAERLAEVGGRQGNKETRPHGGVGDPLSAEQALLSLRVLDYASGSGHILIGAARRLARRLAQIRTGDEEPSPAELRAALREVVRHCIYGVDINPMAVELCKVALWLETLEPGKPLSFLDHHIQCGNSLVGTGVGEMGRGRDGEKRGEGEQGVLEMEVDEGAGLVVPDEAFAAVAGDDKGAASFLRKLNRTERGIKAALIFLQTQEDLARWQRVRAGALEAMPEDSPEQVAGKASAYEAYLASLAYRREKLAHDLWTAAFFWPIRPGAGSGSAPAPTHGQLVRARSGQPLDEDLSRQIAAIAERVPFFHWPLAFPEVFKAGAPSTGSGRGFDCVLSNPPWERIKLQEEEFFAARDPEIAGAANKAARQKLIEALPQTNPALHDAFMAAKHDAEATSKFVRASGRFPLTAVGDVNTYALFAELARTLLAPAGRAGIIVPTGIATDDTTKRFFSSLVETGSLARLIGYENEAFIFPAVHHAFKFCLLTMTGSAAAVERADLAFFCRHYEDADDPRRRFAMSSADFALINPNTRTCPIFRTRADAELTKQIFQRVPVLLNFSTGADNWQAQVYRAIDIYRFGQRGISEEVAIADAGRLAGNVFLSETHAFLPLYESKLIHQFDHRYATYANVASEDRKDGRPLEVGTRDKQNPLQITIPRWWFPSDLVSNLLQDKGDRNWLIAYRDVTNSTNERSTICAIIPYSASDYSIRLVFGLANQANTSCLLVANFNALAFDYIVRQKLAGMHLSDYIMAQLPVLPPASYTGSGAGFIVPRVLELTYSAWDIKAFADDLWRDAAADLTGLRDLSGLIRAQWDANRAATGGHPWDPPAWAEIAADGCPLPPFKWDDDRRARLRAELDAYYARLYGLRRDDLRYILDPKDIYGPDFPGETFRVLKEKEERAYGEYRTRRLVLEAWDSMEGSPS